MRRPRATDATVAGLLVVGCLVELAFGPWTGVSASMPFGRGGAALLFVLPVVWWRSHPLAAAMMAACAGPVLLLTGATFDGMPIMGVAGLTVVAFGAGDRLSRGHAITAVAILLVGVQGSVQITDDGLPVPVYFIVFPWLVGRAMRSRRELADHLLRVYRELDVERRRHLELAVLRERRRVQRELHDSVGHAMSLIVVQAAAGRHLAARSADQARESLDAIQSVAEQAGTELRHLQTVVADDEGDDGRLALLPQLLARAEAAGLSVVVHMSLTAADLATEADRIAYRVIREAFTNVVRYAPGADVTIRLHEEDGGVVLTVTNGEPRRDAVPSAATLDGVGTGSGLAGLREGIEACGGTLQAGPSGPGWAVRVRLPGGEGAG